MITRILKFEDIVKYSNDILMVYSDNRLIFDSQNIISLKTNNDVINFLANYSDADDSMILGILDEELDLLLGIIIFDKIRVCKDRTCAQVHIATSRLIWGKPIYKIYKSILENLMFNVLYCEIPSIAVNAIRMAKAMGFKKTGYIPTALPYVNSRGEEKLYDIQILTMEKK